MAQQIIDLAGMGSPFLQSPFGTAAGSLLEQQSAVGQLAQALSKSMEAGFPLPDSAPGSIAPVMPESLEATITSLIWTEDHLKLLKKLKKHQATNTVHQFIRLLEHGHDLPPFVGEGLIPDLESDPNWERVFARLRIAVRLGRVTDIAGLVKIVGTAPNMIAEANKRVSLSLLGSVEDSLFFGNSAINPLGWDGLVTQILANSPEECIFDLRGEHLTPEMIDEGVATVLDNAGAIDSVWMANGVRMALGQIGGDKLKLERPTGTADSGGTQVGLAANAAITVGGNVPFETSYFLQAKKGPKAAGVGAADKPAQPTISNLAAAGSGSQFAAGDAGSYWYVAVAVGATGKSIPSAAVQVAVLAGQNVSLDLTDGAVGNVIYYELFRSDKDGAADTIKKVGEVRWTGAPTPWTDTNDTIPGMTYSFGLSFRPEDLEFAQLGMPAVRVPLAKIDLSDRFAIVLIGALLLKAPTKILLFRNVNPTRIVT